MSRCLECAHLAALNRVRRGSPEEIQVGHTGALARGLALCGVQKGPGGYPLYRGVDATDHCEHFERVGDAGDVPAKKRIELRESRVAELREHFMDWWRDRKARVEARKKRRKTS